MRPQTLISIYSIFFLYYFFASDVVVSLSLTTIMSRMFLVAFGVWIAVEIILMLPICCRITKMCVEPSHKTVENIYNEQTSVTNNRLI